jgi:pullulanase/glycogen debranching enzyme
MVNTYHVDGFRFDLGALLDKRTILDIDRQLPKDIHLFAEPWAFGPTKWGKGDMRTAFADTRWAIWNDDFREPLKAHITGSATSFENRDKLKVAITGGHRWASRPQQSVNYFASHDGLSSADIVDGHRQRLFSGVTLTLFSQGIPMISEGTEFMHTKRVDGVSYDSEGRPVTYNRPDLNQLDWRQAATHADLTSAIAKLIALRKRLPHFKYRRALREGRDITWLYPQGYPHNDNVNAFGFVLRPPPGKRAPRGFGELTVLSNGSNSDADFSLPAGRWKLISDGERIEVDPKGLAGRVVDGGHYRVQPGATVVLAGDP